MKNPFPLFFLLFLLFAASCNAPRNSENQPVETAAVIADSLWMPDSLFTPTGNAKLDSLLKLAATAKPDTNLAQLYFEIGDLYLNNDPQKAKEYYLKLKTLSEQLNWNIGYYKFAQGFTDVLNSQGLMDSSILIHQKALNLAKAEKNELHTVVILVNLGNCYNYKKWYKTALNYYYDGFYPLFFHSSNRY